MARKKPTVASLPPDSGFKASASFLMDRGDGPSQAASAKPVAMNEEPHTEFIPVYIHTAKCDMCEKRNYGVLHRCVTCTSQFCYRCMRAGDGTHKMSIDMNWTDYGAQANSNPILKSQRKAQEYVSRNRPGNVFRQRYTSAANIPSCRYHHRELRNAREGKIEPFVADEIPDKAGPAPKRQKSSIHQEPHPWGLAAAVMNNTRAENAKKDRTEAQFPLIIPSHEDDYGPKFQSFLSNIRDMTDDDDDITEEESTSSGNNNHDPRGISNFFSGISRVSDGTRNSRRLAPNPYAKEIKEHKKDITEELSLIEKHIDLIKDKKRLALMRKTHIDEALDAACILMSMRTDARGFPDEKETSVLASGSLAREHGKDKDLGTSHTFKSMQTGARSVPADLGYVFKERLANARPFVGDSQARASENNRAAGASASTGIPGYAEFSLNGGRSHLTEAGRLALEKERKIDAVVEAAYYTLMREGQSSQLRPRETRK
ncbi:hypothetical protein VE03_03714 [Pseudogymnoascus sp. 23342-1-I1]|nr:hypothetical protein VE03_03714 [Pseudogymnoascus sp. 23342-1-I1]